MSNFIDAAKAGVKAMAEELRPGRFTIEGRPVLCPYCGRNEFTRRPLQSAQGIQLLGIACTGCNTVIVFERSPQRAGPVDS